MQDLTIKETFNMISEPPLERSPRYAQYSAQDLIDLVKKIKIDIYQDMLDTKPYSYTATGNVLRYSDMTLREYERYYQGLFDDRGMYYSNNGETVRKEPSRARAFTRDKEIAPISEDEFENIFV